jgi:hypothetical protein
MALYSLDSFDQTYYLANNPDVVSAIASGIFSSALEHYELYGENEGRMPSALFDPGYYFSQNPDVLAAVSAGIIPGALWHYENYGLDEGRQPSATLVFDETYYLATNPDVAQAVADGIFDSGWEHFVFYGSAEGRSPAEGEEGGLPGQTFVLTTGVDVIAGTPDNDAIIGYINQDTASGTTLNSADVIDGAAGFDTLQVTIEVDSLNNLNLNMTNVERMQIRDFDGQDFYIQNVAGLNTISMVGGDNETTSFYDGTYIVPNIEFHNGEYTVYQDAGVVAKIDMLSVTVDNADAEVYQYSANPDGGRSNYQHATINSIGAGFNDGWNYLYLGESQGADGVTVTGTTNLELDIEHFTNNAGTAGSVNTVDASALEGGLATSLDFNGASGETKSVMGGMGGDILYDYSADKAFVISYDTGTGDDLVDIDNSGISNQLTIDLGADNDTLIAGDRLDAADSVDGGEGQDTLSVTSAWATGLTAAGPFSNFERLELSTALAADLDMTKLDNMQYVILDDGLDATPRSITGLTSGATIEYRGDATGDDLTVDASGALNINLTSDNSISGGTVTATGATSVEIVTTDTDDTTPHQDAIGLATLNATSINVSGNAGLYLDPTGINTKVTSFDASGVTATGAAGSVTYFSENATATASVTITGGNGDDFLWGNDAKDTISGGDGSDWLYGYDGADTLNGGAGADNLYGGIAADTQTGGAGNDIFWFTAVGDSQGTTKDTVTDFVSGVDLLDFSVITGGVGSYLGEANGYGAVLTSLTASGAAEAVLDISTSTLYLDANGDGVLDANDMAIDLTGVTDLTGATDFAF